MKRAADLIGLPVIKLTSGEIIGEVDDVIFIPISKKIKGLIIKNKNKYFIQTHNINKIGEDAIIIEDNIELRKFKKTPGMGIKAEENTLIGDMVITKSGKELGLISDLVIDENEQHLIGYEVSEGLIQDLFQGRNILPIGENLKYGKDAVIYNDEEGD